MYLKLNAGRAAAVSPSDTVEIPSVTGGTSNNGCVLYIGGFGDLKVLTVGGDLITFVGVNGGTFFPVQVTMVYSTGTTATGIIALW
jgi:hypothetical protein|tara:strand:- start:18 stop:275 length:258 start_codon:yes stop_codon:yes gene_type:complete